MNKKIIVFVIALMGLSLVGIIGFQVFWINHALKVKEEAFNRSVAEALHDVVEKLETQEAMHVISQQMQDIRLARQLIPETEEPARNTPVAAQVSRPELVNEAKAKPRIYKAADSIVLVDMFQKGVFPSQEIRTYAKEFNRQSEIIIKNTPLISGLVPSEKELQNLVSKLVIKLDTARLHNLVFSRQFEGRLDSGLTIIYRQDSLLRTTRKDHLRASVHQQKNGAKCCPDSIKTIFIKANPSYNTVTRVNSPAHPLGQTRYVASFINSQEMLEPATAITKVPPRMRPNINEKQNTHLAEQQVPAPPTPPRRPVVKKQNVKVKATMLTDVIQKMAEEYVCQDLPIEDRITTWQLDSLLKQELGQRGILLPYEFAVVNNQATGILPIHTAQFNPKHINSKFRVKLFPHDIFAQTNFLTLHFYGQNQQVLKSLGYMMGFSVLFTCIIVSTFLFTTYTILKQKKISEVKNDFINNMTHEFKTPLATISLATDSINNPKVLENKDRIQHYTRIIRDENQRLHHQVESVLQMAMLEKGQLNLNYTQVNMHDLICEAMEHMNLHLEASQGRISANLEATTPTVWGDEAHLGNVICNLLDNANKYSPTQPEIVIQTQNTPAGLVLSVTDKGLGMSKDTQKRIFDRFFRVCTGNIHTVKGFGLGLSYVKAIMVAHKGQVTVKSELGKGSRFELLFPITKNI